MLLRPARYEDHDHVDVLFELLDASLIRVQETDDGEPRFTSSRRQALGA